MKTLTINLPDKTIERITKVANELGISVDEWVQASIEEKLNRLELDFKETVKHVLEKNAELYRRLS